MSAAALERRGVRVTRSVQRQGQYMVIWPHTAVASVSCGYNISESLRFATVRWLPYGIAASKVGQLSDAALRQASCGPCCGKTAVASVLRHLRVASRRDCPSYFTGVIILCIYFSHNLVVTNYHLSSHFLVSTSASDVSVNSVNFS